MSPLPAAPMVEMQVKHTDVQHAMPPEEEQESPDRDRRKKESVVAAAALFKEIQVPVPAPGSKRGSLITQRRYSAPRLSRHYSFYSSHSSHRASRDQQLSPAALAHLHFAFDRATAGEQAAS